MKLQESMYCNWKGGKCMSTNDGYWVDNVVEPKEVIFCLLLFSHLDIKQNLCLRVEMGEKVLEVWEEKSWNKPLGK